MRIVSIILELVELFSSNRPKIPVIINIIDELWGMYDKAREGLENVAPQIDESSSIPQNDESSSQHHNGQVPFVQQNVNSAGSGVANTKNLTTFRPILSTPSRPREYSLSPQNFQYSDSESPTSRSCAEQTLGQSIRQRQILKLR